jgi:hypothetical protein
MAGDAAAVVQSTTGRRWLLFVHQLPATPSHLRVRTWRRMQKIGAVALKQAVHVLPDSPTAREHFEWLKAEVTSAGGDASVFSGDCVDRWADDALVDEFRRSRQDAYAALATEIEDAIARVLAKRPPRGSRRPAVRRLVEGFRQRLSALEHIDFFGSAGRDRVATLVRQLEGHVTGSNTGRPTPDTGPADRAAYGNRLWVTRPRPGVDRMSSAWLIRRFIDAGARFAFAPDRDSLPEPDAVPFDMFGVELTHRGEACTFETLCGVFGLGDPALLPIAAIVHDLDLKDDRFGAPEAGTVSAVIEGLQLATTDDAELLERGIVLFESLYQAFSQRARPAGPRQAARPQGRGPTRRSHARRSQRRT